MTSRLFRRAGILVAAILISTPAARSFDTQPHFDMTRDALAAEGFGDTAIEVAQVANWFNDLYENASQNPFSGHAPWYKELLVGAWGSREHWPEEIIDAADRMHFDSASNITGTPGAEAEWSRLLRAARNALGERAAANDDESVLVALGSTLHAVQDFYTHTNWVEPKDRLEFDGPGWSTMGLYGSHPTWFDIPPDVRSRAMIYSSGKRSHGSWNAERTDGFEALNKDCAGRPYYLDAYITAYIASRQWVQAVRGWIGDEAKWASIRAYADRHGNELDHDQTGADAISVYSGHWNGNGEPSGGSYPGPGGSLVSLANATSGYFKDHDRSSYRSRWENLILRLADPNPPGNDAPVPSSLPIQQTTRFLEARMTRIRQIDNMDFDFGGGIVGIDVDEADWYSRARIDGQNYTSGLFSGHDSIRFQPPYGAFTFIKAISRAPTTVPAIFELWDDDSYFYFNDDHADISPAHGRKALKLFVNAETGDVSGDVTGTGTVTSRGTGDSNRAEVRIEFQTITPVLPGPPPEKYKVIVSFLEARVSDTARPNRGARLAFGFRVNEATASAAVTGALQSPIALDNQRLTVRPEYPANLDVTIDVEDENRKIAALIRQPDTSRLGSPTRVKAPMTVNYKRLGDGGEPGRKPIRAAAPMTLNYSRSHPRDTRFDSGVHTARMSGNGVTIEVTYQIVAALIRDHRPGR